MLVKVKLEDKGQVVIPKVVRDSVGLMKNRAAILEVKDNKIEITPLHQIDVDIRGQTV